jgi:transmembrane sensor
MSEIDWELLNRYLAGEATDEERERIEAWLAEDPERWAQLAALRDALAQADLGDSAVEQAKAEVWARLERELGGAGQGARGSGRAGTPRLSGGARDFALPPSRRWSVGAQIAAALLVAVLGGVGAFALLYRDRPAVPQLRVANTAAGQRSVFRLPDGTRVVLGVASTLRFPAAFEGGSRDVSLEGEAYFEVSHDELRGFVVRAGDLVAKDLGTQFTVRAYPEDAGARVVVREGRVAIRAAGAAAASERVVAPGQLGRLAAGNKPTVEPADTAVYFAWTEGRLVFDGTPLRDALPQLSRWFDLEFRLADTALGGIPLSATLRTQPTPDVLDNLAASLGLRERRDGRVVTLFLADSGR